MKKILISIFVFVLILSGCKPYSSPRGDRNQEVSPTETSDSSFNYIRCLTLNEIKTALIREGLNLSENREESPAFYQIDDTMPAILNIEDTNQTLLIYVFKTIGQLKEIYPYGGASSMPYIDILPQKGNYPSRAFSAHNVLIVDLIKINMPQEIRRNEQALKALQKAAVSLNDTQRAVFVDRGTYWDARYVIDYYQHWYKDDRGTTQLDQDSEGKWTVKYTGSNPESIHNLKYEYETLAGGGSHTDSGNGILKKVGDSYYLQTNSGNGGIPGKESFPNINIQWDGQQESLKLKMIE